MLYWNGGRVQKLIRLPKTRRATNKIKDDIAVAAVAKSVGRATRYLKWDVIEMYSNTKASLFQKAIAAAKKGDGPTANSILSKITANPFGRENQLSDVERKLIGAIRDTYDISDTTKPIRVEERIKSQKNAIEGVTLVTCCMNRTDNLLKALPTWLESSYINEVIIVDWASESEVKGVLDENGISDDRILFLRVDDEPRWILSYAFNLGFRFASFNKIIKADADIMLKEGFFRRNELKRGEFISGNWEFADKGQEHINGFFYIYHDDLMNVGGFNEYITTYGWDDDELYGRLAEFGLRRVCVDTESIYHIPHEDAERFQVNESKLSRAIDELRDDPLWKIRANRYLAMVLPPWKSGRSFSPFEVKRDMDKCIWMHRKKGEQPHNVINDIRNDSEYYAGLELMSWKVGSEIYHLSKDEFWCFLKQHRMEEITTESLQNFVRQEDKKVANLRHTGAQCQTVNSSSRRLKFFVDAQHGLGNRLRSIASAAAIAERCDRELVVVWQPDHHCDCELSDLFEYEGSVLNESFANSALKEGMRFYNYMEIEDHAEKDALIEVDHLHDVYARSAYVLNSPLSNWDAENKFLRRLTPVVEVRDLVASVVSPRFDVSAHVRMVGGSKYEHLPYESVANWTEKSHEQISFWRQKSHFSHFMKRIDSLINEGRAETVFLAADMQHTYEEFSERYGDRVTYLRRELFDRSAQQLRFSLADALLLGRAPLLLGSTWSSFSELAIRLTQREIVVEMSGKDF